MVTRNMLRKHEGNLVFAHKNIGYGTILDLIKCLKQVKKQIFRIVCEIFNYSFYHYKSQCNHAFSSEGNSFCETYYNFSLFDILPNVPEVFIFVY